MRLVSGSKILFYFLPFLITCRSEEYISHPEMEDDTLLIINAYLEKHHLKSSYVLKVNDTLLWRNNLISRNIQPELARSNIIISEKPVIISRSYLKFPAFFEKNVELVNAIDDGDWYGIYSFSPAFKTSNANEYIIQISRNSYAEDCEFIFLIEFVNNAFRIKEELDGWITID